MLLAPLQTLIRYGPASFLSDVRPVTRKPKTYLVIPDSDWVARCLVSTVFDLNVTMIDPDEVTSVEVEVLYTEDQIAVSLQVFRVGNVNVVLTHCGRIVMVVVVVTEHGNSLVVEVIATKLRPTIIDVVLQDFAATAERQESTPKDQRDHVRWSEIRCKKSDVSSFQPTIYTTIQAVRVHVVNSNYYTSES